MNTAGRYCIIPGRSENARHESEKRIPRATPAPEVKPEQIPADRCYRYVPAQSRETVRPKSKSAKK